MQRALVLGSGGITGTAWELGLLAGLADAGLALTDAAVVVGTSAGSVAAAQICSGIPIGELYARQLQPPATTERVSRFSRRTRLAMVVALGRSKNDSDTFGRRMGAFAVRAAARGRTPSVEQRLATIASRLPSTEWPDRDLWITAVDADSGAFRVFTRADGVALVDAVAASCAVPGVYPPIPIGERTYIDGGYRSGSNVDVARDYEPIVVLAPRPINAGPVRGPQQQLDALGVRGVVISPDGPASAGIGANAFDPAARGGAAEAGRDQAARVVERVRAACD
ncbi:MAG TPA: patatin-like phospholipase family protein [Solirubrobacteraceae bacterium]|nr:patatin-like phospholipase family protein [Solirubrobacteraceae bacterium]